MILLDCINSVREKRKQ